MSENTKIEWATHTFNGWEGCAKVSPGCANCYAETRAERFGQVQWGKGQPRRRTSAANWRLPLKWQREEAAKMVGHAEFAAARRPRVFSASLSDWLDDEVPIEWLADLLRLIHDTPSLDWLLLTKRPENFRPRLLRVILESCSLDVVNLMADNWLSGTPPANVWPGASVENQRGADERIPQLLRIPAKLRFLSMEPMLEEVRLDTISLVAGYGYGWANPLHGTHPSLNQGQRGPVIDWVIVGGESGPGARPCDVAWVRSIVHQCQSAGVPCFVKQLGSRAFEDVNADPQTGEGMLKLKHPKGGDPAEWPADLRTIRQFPL